MQGIILTGGTGSRLSPLTDNCNKHLLDVCGRPMIFYSIAMFVSAGISDVTLVTNPHQVDDFKKVLSRGVGSQFNPLRIVPQKNKPGIAGSIQMMPPEHRNGPYMVVLGDNIVGGTVRKYRDIFDEQPDKALILLSEVQSPEAFGVVHMKDGQIKSIEEKPKSHDSHWAITGIYFFPKDLFEVASKSRPSDRGEYEVTDILVDYLNQDRLRYEMLEHWWLDAGTHKDLAEVKKRISGEGTEEEADD
ncbi:MAG: NTP transferase domain-containing protein [candidate division Zixibacteria bacterium]|nr:NTP transferase domain-containing protein [candidate division Zixibacteria bacterium]